MIGEIVRNLLRFLFFTLIQVVIVKHLDLGSFINPFLYVICILMLPINMDKGWVMITAFAIGLIVDMFYNTMGINAAACVFMAYCRPGILRLIAPKGEYETTARPTLSSMGLIWVLSYSGSLVLLHHLVLFYLEAFTFSSFFTTLAKAILSSFATVALILLSQVFMQKTSTR
jgi:rod shape-determining protein MreD